MVLHTTDITLLEVKRQIYERVQTRRRELVSIEKDFRRWRKQAPKSTPKRLPEFDAEALSTELFERFRMFLVIVCQAEVHRALIAPEAVPLRQVLRPQAAVRWREQQRVPRCLPR